MMNKEFEEWKEYALKAHASIRRPNENDYWKFSDSRINEKAPQYRGNCTIVYGGRRSGKTFLLEKMIKEVPNNVLKVVIVFGGRDEESDWYGLADRVIGLPASSEIVFGSKGMWDRFFAAYLECLRETVINHRDVLLVIDSCSELIPVCARAGLTPEGTALPGGIDQNAAEYVRTFLSQYGVFREGGSLTIWGTSFIWDDEEPFSKGATPILQSVATSHIILDKSQNITNRSYTSALYVDDKKRCACSEK